MSVVRKKYGPERVWTGTGRRACDGAVVELVYDEQDDEGNPVLTLVRVLELHDINVAERHAEREVAWFLKRCAAQIEAEGLTLIDEEDVHYIPPERLEIGRIRFQQFCTPTNEWGPFSSGR